MFQHRFILGLVASFLSLDLYIIVALGAVHHVVQMKSLETASSCSPSAKGPARGLRIGHTCGPCSPLTPKNSARRLSEILIQHESRIHSINSLTSNNNLTNDHGMQNELLVVDRGIGNGNFVVIVGFGTPKRDFKLIFDTGSDLTWIKCKSCAGKNCDSKENPSYYNPYISSTFLNGTTTYNSSYDYSVIYRDDSSSEGYYVRDTLTLTPSDLFPHFVFGCSQKNSDDMFGSADGLLGVGQSGSDSLISQTKQKFEIFCHCLPANVDSTGYLLFGEEAVETCQTNQFTTLLSHLNSPYYYVNLIGITIGNQRLNVSSTVVSNPKTILDSGTVITRLPPSVYKELRSAFQASMSQYPQVPPPMQSLLDTCYKVTKNKNAKIPSMVMHYAGLDVNLDSSSTVKWEEEGTQACLAFTANESEDALTIIGNHQQLNLNVFYNIPERKVSFGTGGCGK